MAESSNIKARDIVKGVFSSYAPVTMNSIDSARTVASDIRTIGRKINTGMRQNMMQIDKSQPGRRAIALFNAAKDALKDGTYEINQANDGMYDDFEEYESSFTLDDMTEDERANSSPEEIILRGNRGVAQSVIRATTAQLEGMDAVSNKVLRGFIKTADASAKSINATIIYGTNMLSTQLGTMNTKLDAINANLVNLIEYQNENTTTYYEKNLEMMNSMLESMNNLNAMTHGKGARDLKNFDVRNGFNIKDYIDRVKKGIKNSAMVSGVGTIASMANIANENPDIMSMGELIGNSLSMFIDMVPGLNTKMTKLNKIDKRASQYINEALYKIGDKLSGNIVASVLGLDSLGNKRRRNYGIDMSSYMKEQLPWNGKAQKALTEVIPELLTSIDSGINKTDKRYFDYEQGYFKSRKEIEKDFADQVSTSISLEFNEMINQLGKKFDLSGKTPEEIAAAKNKVSNIINKRIYGEGDLTTARQEMADTLQSMNLSANEFSSAFNNIEQAISSVTDQIAELYSRVGSTDSVFRNINNRSGATSREAIGKEAYRTLKAYRTSGAKETSIFRDGVATDVKETIDRITRTIQAEIPEFRMTTEYKQYINMAVRRGDDDYEILRAVKNTFGKSNIIDLAKKKLYGLFGKDAPIQVPDASDDDNIDLGRYGNAVDMALLQRVYGVKTNYPGVKATYQSNKEEKSKSRSKNGVGDTTLTNKAASSQRSRMDGKSAGAEVAHAKTSPSEGMSSEFPINQDTENLKGAIIDAASQSADKILNADDSSLDRDEKLRDTAAQAIIDIGKEGSTSFGGALKNVLDTMVLSMGSMISSFTGFGSRLFGKEGIIKNFFKSEEFKSGMNKVKDFLIGDENGIFKDQWAKLKEFGKETWDKTKDKLTDAYDWVYRNYSTYKYGENYENEKEWQNDELMQKLNLKKRRQEKKAKQAEAALKSSENERPTGTLTTSTGKVIHQNASGRWVDANNKFVSNKEVADAMSSTNDASIDTTVAEVQSVTEKLSSADKTSRGKSSVPEIEKTTDEVKSSVDQVATETPAILKESVEKIADAGSEAARDLKESTEKITTAMIGDPNANPEDVKKKYAKSFTDKVKSILPKVGAGAIVGAGVGFLNGFGGASLLGSMFLPTGLIGGAIVGGGLTILSQTEAFRSLMFGKKDKDGNRSGGLISKNLREKFKKVAPIAVGGAITGAIGSILKAPITGDGGLGVLGMQLLPGGILGGAIMGMGVGLLKNSETFQNVIFGKKNENGERSGTWLSKSFNKMKDKMAGSSEYIKNAIKGGVIGTVTGATLANAGFLGAAIASGPIGMGVAGLGVGIAASTNKFQDWLFGTEEFDDNGKSLGRKGGILGRVKNLININVVEPISTSFRSAMLDMIDWTKDKITMPFRTAFGPILDSIKGIKDNVVDFVKGQFETIGNGITSMIKKTLGTLFSPITKLIGGIGKAMIGGAKVGIKAAALPLTAGLSAMNFLTSGTRRKEYAKFYKHYYTEGGIMESLRGYWDAEQKDYDEEAAEYNAEAIKNGKATKKAKKVGTFDKISDFLGAITGNGVIADAARKGYNKSMSEGGQNTMDWRSVVRERKQMKKDAQKRHDAERQWNEISKLSRSIGNKDLGGRNVTLNETQFKKYKDKFVKAGIDPSLINTNDDLMQLIYDPQGFRKKASGDSNLDGFMQALKDYRLTPEEVASMKRTEEYQDNVTKYLESFSKKFEAIGEEVLFDRSVTSYTEDRKKDTKRLRNKLKKAYKTTLWEGRQAIDLNDPELYEYDIEGITDEDLQDYAASNFADNNDFKGYLESIGRKMSPNDDRVAYHSAVKVNGVWKRTTGKSSEERPPESKPNSTEGAVITNDTSTNVNETTTQSETNNRFDWKQATEDANRNKKKGKSSEERPPESKPNTNDATQAAVLNELKQTRELQETNLELQSGGEITADKVKKNGYKDFGKSKMSKFSIGGVLTNLFNRKSKEDKTKEAAAKEAEEQKQATALGDEANQTGEKSEGAMIVKDEETKEKKKSIFSRIFGAIGSGFTIFGSSKIGKLLIGGVKLFGGLGLAAGIGLTIAEMAKPGTADKIGASIQKWNDETLKAAEDGTFIDNIKTRISGWFDNMGEFINTKVLSEDGYLVTGAQKIADVMPTFMEKFVVPGIQNSANFIANNAETLVGAAGTVITAIAPPLAEAIATVIPSVIGSLGKGFWNGLWGKTPKTKGKENLTDEQKASIKESGGSYRTGWVDVSEEEYKQYWGAGYPTRVQSGKYQVYMDYSVDSNVYVDDKGRDQTRTKQGVLSRVAQFGSRLGINIATGRERGAAKMVGSAARWIGKGFGGITGGILGSIVPGTGTIAGAAGGAKVGEKFVDTIGRGVKSIFNKVTGKTAETAAEKAATKSGGNFIQNFINKITKKGVSEAAEDTAAKALLEAAGKTAGSGMDDVAKVAAKESDNFLKKIINVIKGIPNNAAVKKVIDSVAGTKAAQVLSGLKKWVGDAVKKLTSASAEVIKGTKLGKKIQILLSEKAAKQGAKSAAAVGTAMLADIAFVTIGGVTGAFDAANLFEVSKNAVDWKMRVISGLLNGILNTSIGGWVDIALLVLELFTGFDARKYVASFLYKHISLDSGESAAKLDAAQDQLAIETALYNQANGTNMSASEYNDVTNKTVLGKAWDWIRGKKVDTKQYSNQAKQIMKSGNYTKDKNGNITINNVTATVGNGTGAVGYGPASQADTAWANMPIGRFANGKVSTMRTGGCGPTALSTIANMFGKGTINPGTVGAYAARNGYITDGGANEDLFTKGAAGLGLAGAKVSGSNFNTALNSGMPMAISGKNSGPFTKAGHVVVAKGTDKNGNINIIDPIDGKLKKYSKSSITSGMTNAWAYDKPIGYGPVSTLKNVITNGLSDETKKMIVNNLGLVQNAISNVPQIMLDTMEGVFKVAAKAIVTPIAVPIEFAVKSLGIIGKLIAGDTSYLTTEEIHSSSNTTSMLTKMSNSLRKTYSSSTAKVSTSKVSVNKLRSTTNKTSNNTNILTKAWNWITGKSKKAGNGYGSIGYGPTNTNGLFMPTLSMPGMNNNLAKINNGQAGPVSYEHIYDENYKHGLSMGLSSAQASDAANAQAASTWKKTTGNDTPSSITNTKGSSTEGIKYNTADGKPKSKSSSSNQTTDDSVVLSDDISDTSTEMSGWEKAKEALSGPVTTLGGLVGGLKQFGNVMSALLGSIIGEGTFMDLLNGNKEDTAAGNTVTSSGVTLSSDAEKELIWKTLINEGYSKQAAAAIMGCWQAESHNKARVIEANWISEFPGYNVVPADRDALDNFTRNGVFKKTKNVKKSAYYNSADNRYYPGIGYAQWTGPRAYNMLNYMSKNRYNWDDPESQIKWFDYEMNGSYKGTKDNLKRATTVTMATKRFFNGYEMGKDADTKYPNMYNTRLNYAKQIYDMYNKSSVGNGKGAVGFGPDEDKGPSNWSEFLSGASAATDYLQSRLNEMGIGEYLNISNPMASITDESGVNSSVSFDPSMWKNSPDQLKPVNAMRSIYGQLNYSQDGTKQNPEKGASSCASTVAWAYNKALGIRPGDTVSRDAYMSSTAQSKDNRFTTIWTNNGSGLTDDFVKNYMQPGDIVYQNWNQSYNNGEMRHTEMYAGNGQTLSHGGPNWSDKGPVYKNLLSNSRKKHTMMIRRYNGFLNNNTTGYGQGSSNDRLTLENNFLREVDEQKNRVNKTRLGKEGDRAVGFGPSSDTSNLEERLDKIFNVITEWYLMEKKKYNTKGFGPGTVTNTTVVNNDNSTKVIKTPEKKQTKVDFNSNLDKLTQKHSAFARMYKSGI